MISARSGRPSTSSRIRSSNLTVANDADLEPEVAQQTADIVLDGDGLFLQQLASGQQGAALSGWSASSHAPVGTG